MSHLHRDAHTYIILKNLLSQRCWSFWLLISSFSLSLIFFIIYRIFINTLQNGILDAFRKVLVALPASLDVLREEGIWELIFSENFFYFELSSEDSVESCTYYESPREREAYSSSNTVDNQAKIHGVEILQMEVISFVEFAATSNGSVHNLVLFLSRVTLWRDTFTSIH